MFKLHRLQCNSCINLTETLDIVSDKPCEPICGWSMASFKGETKNKCSAYEYDKSKVEHCIPNVFVNAFKDSK